MEKMPFQPEMAGAVAIAAPAMPSVVVDAPAAPLPMVTTSDWRRGLPVLTSSRVTLRELRLTDAPALFSMLSSEEITRFISPPPTSVEGFERFIAWALRERDAGNYICFAVVPDGMSTAVGLFQLRSLAAGFATAEWGFVIGSAFWGSGVFADGAKLVLDFAFEVVGVHRLEARASTVNGRGNGALRKIGAVQEGILRRSLLRHGKYHDQVLWSIVNDDWHVRLDRRSQVH